MAGSRTHLGFTEHLGLVGWRRLEPVLLAALAGEAPLLLVGPHGTGKSLLVERVAGALGLPFRHYNASLLNYDDLVGIPLPDEAGSALRFVASPGAIWDAGFVFLDELSRCRPELQNKLFPIVHERRVAGVDLPRLTHRWAAMNPPAPDDAESAAAGSPAYLGAEPLDPALADRFPFVVRVPTWDELSLPERLRLVAGAGPDAPPGRRPRPRPLPALVEAVRAALRRLRRRPMPRLPDYVVQLAAQLETAGLPLSPRRARMLADGVIAVHAARLVLEGTEAALEESARLALQSGLPQTAAEVPPAAGTLHAAHRQAWKLSGLVADDLWRRVLEERDPVRRVALGDRLGLSDDALSRLVTQALAAVGSEARRLGLATALFLRFRTRRDLAPAAWEPLGERAGRVLRPPARYLSIGPGPATERWREIHQHLAAARKRGEPLPRLESNFLRAGFPEVWALEDWRPALEAFRADLALFEAAGEVEAGAASDDGSGAAPAAGEASAPRGEEAAWA